MKKLIYVALLSAFVISCASHPGRVCGGPGGGRVVEHMPTEKAMQQLSIV